MSENPITITPTAWLWSQLDALLTANQLSGLRAGFQAQSKRYNRASQIRQTERELALYRRNMALYEAGSTRYIHYAEKIQRRRERLAALEADEA